MIENGKQRNEEYDFKNELPTQGLFRRPFYLQSRGGRLTLR